jgi:peptidoglycan/LPS O-acetylase OafA/YrhL
VLEGGAARFFTRRARRILPPYYMALAFSLILLVLFPDDQDSLAAVTLPSIATHLLLIHHLFPSTSTTINGALWSISVEWWIYFLFPLLVALFRRWGAALTIVATALGSLAISLILLQTPLDMSSHGVSPQYLALFALGMGSARIAYSDRPGPAALRARAPWAAISALLLALLGGLALLCKYTSVPPYLSDYIVGLWGVSLLICASREGGRIRRAFAWGPLAWIGTFAYSIYLIHMPLLRLAWLLVIQPLGLTTPASLALLALAGGPVIIGACYLFFLAAERPFMRNYGRGLARIGAGRYALHEAQPSLD